MGWNYAWLAAPVVVVALATGCGDELQSNEADDDPTVERISRDDFGADWPLTVSHGELRCEEPSAVVFTAPDGTEYGVNGMATTQGYAEIDPIWRRDPSGIVPRMDIGPLIDRGLELCL